MNVRLPKTYDSVSSAFYEGVALFVALSIDLLNTMQRISVNLRVCVPEISVPLDYEMSRCYQDIDDKSAADYLLLRELYTDFVEDASPSGFKFICFWMVWKAQYSIDAFHIFTIIAACMRAVFDFCTQPPARYVKMLVTCQAASNFTAAEYFKRALTCDFFSVFAVLPFICTLQRAESDVSASTGNKYLDAPFAGVGAAWSTYLLDVGAPFKHFMALFTPTFLLGYVVRHVCIIPWRVE